VLGFPVAQQLRLASGERDNLPAILRGKIEAVGVLTLRTSALAKHGARGMCLALFPLPVIVFTSEAPTAQAFTIAHELGHVLLRQSAISGALPKSGGSPTARRVEEWCNRFAGAFLVPAAALASVVGGPSSTAERISDSDLKQIAEYFKVSPHSMLVRLVHLKYVVPKYYWEVKRPQFLEEEKSYTSFRRPSYYASRYRSQQGDPYTSLVLEAWSSGAINNHNAAEFMGIKDLDYLNQIRDRFARE
jgi:Zn-dependent peptidase ImmA (M78 family)